MDSAVEWEDGTLVETELLSYGTQSVIKVLYIVSRIIAPFTCSISIDFSIYEYN